MKHVFKALVTGAALAASGSAHALVEENEVLVGILNVGNQQSMLIDTNLIAQDFADGTISSYASDPTLTSTIQSFLGGSDAQFWAVGAWSPTFLDNFALTLGELGPVQTNDFANVRMPSLVGQANTALGGADVVTGLLPGDPAHFDTLALGALSFDSVGSADFWFSQDTLFVDSSETIGTWALDAASGLLTYNTGAAVVPLPAGVWLLGVGLAGYLGVARRRAAA
jgi:hypothetical protein